MDRLAALEELCALLAGDDHVAVWAELGERGLGADAAGEWLSLCDALEAKKRLIRIDWKESPREVGAMIAVLVRRAAPAAKKPRWSTSELDMDTDEFLHAAGAKLARQDLLLMAVGTDGDEMPLVIVSRQHAARIQSLAKSGRWGETVVYGVEASAATHVPTTDESRRTLSAKRAAEQGVGTFDVGIDVLALPGPALVVIDDRKLHLITDDRATSVALPVGEVVGADRSARSGALFRTAHRFGLFFVERLLFWNGVPRHPLCAADVDVALEWSSAFDGALNRYVPVAAVLLETSRELFVVVTDSYRSFVARLAIDTKRGVARCSGSVSELPASAFHSLIERPSDGAYRFLITSAHLVDDESRVRLTLAGLYGHAACRVEVDRDGAVRILERLDDSPWILSSKDGRTVFRLQKKKGKYSLWLDTSDGRALGALALTKALIAPIAWELLAYGWWRVDVLDGDVWLGGVRAPASSAAWNGHYVRLNMRDRRAEG